MMLNFFKDKLEVIRINVSTTFLIRSRCKGCGSSPQFYYIIRNKRPWFDPNKVIKDTVKFKSLYKRICHDHYMILPTRYFNSLQSFSHQVSYKGFNPKLHLSRGKSFINNVTEFLMCECGDTSWAFNQKSVQHTPEVENRKAKYKYPKKFEY